jgi:predicted O-methyltransferase YrrM
MHSPFVFDFITKVLNDQLDYPGYQVAENVRKKMSRNNRELEVEDFGAGSVYQAYKKRSVSSIARQAAKPPKYARLLYRMVQYYKPGLILELGTSLGITTTYLALANPVARVITMEGAKAIAATAADSFSANGLSSIELVEGNFDTTLPALLGSMGTVDFAFIDGNHRKEPTLRYFAQLLPHRSNDSIFVFDDIHWSKDMEEAWTEIQQHPSVRCSIDLFFIGIVIFRKEFREKQQFEIRF